MKIFIIHTPSDDGFSDVIKTLRIGFPKAIVHHIDNKNKERHDKIITRVFVHNLVSDEPVVFCDPDTIFYDNVEKRLQSLGPEVWLSGRFIPNYWNNVVEANEVKRYHTSLLYFGAPKTTLNYLRNIEQHPNFPLHYFAPFKYYLNNVPFFYDTCANLYHVLPKERKCDFRPDILDDYCHLCGGSILDYVTPKIPNGQRLISQHRLAKTEPNLLRYFWKEQDRFYAENKPRL